VPIGAVGGVSNADFAAYAKVGIRTFGLGSSLYKAGMAADEVSAQPRLRRLMPLTRLRRPDCER
jgi:2-keto-3-deoxy-6-phosphogluconate aldolase